MRTAVCSVDDCIGRAHQLVVETAGDKPSDHGGRLGFARQHEARCRAFPTIFREATMDALDDVVALAEGPQRRLSVFRESPLARTSLVCNSEPFELPHASDLDPLQVIAFPIAVGSQVDDGAVSSGLSRERLVEARPTLGLDLSLQRPPDLLLRARAELARRQPLGPRPHSFPDVIARNDEVLTVIGVAADDEWTCGCAVFQ